MLNYRSVRSSEWQIRSNPALRQASSVFQKNVSTLLEELSPTFPSYSRICPKHGSVLSKFAFHAWERPAHLRSQWIVITDTMPVLLVDTKQSRHVSTLRIPYLKARVQELGPIVCEGAWDAQSHELWLWDVHIWNRQSVWTSQPYSVRWSYLKEIRDSILDVGNPLSDADVVLPTFLNLSDLRTKALDPAYSVEFTPEAKGQRRLLFVHPNTKQSSHKKSDTSNHSKQETPQKHDSILEYGEDTEQQEENVLVKVPEKAPTQAQPQKTKPLRVEKGQLTRDTVSKLPDSYRLTYKGTDMGLMAIRSLDMSLKIRKLFDTYPSLDVDAEWHEPFQKYELKRLYTLA